MLPSKAIVVAWGALFCALGCTDPTDAKSGRPLTLALEKLEAPAPFDSRAGGVVLNVTARVSGVPAACASDCSVSAVFELVQGGGIPVRRLSDERALTGAGSVELSVDWDGSDTSGRRLADDTFEALVTLRVSSKSGETLGELAPPRGRQLRYCAPASGCVPVTSCAFAGSDAARCAPHFTQTDYVCNLIGGFLALPPISSWNFSGTDDKPPVRLPFAFDANDRYAANVPAGGNPGNADNPVVAAADLGSPLEHTDGSGKRRLVFLFGDTQPVPLESYPKDQNGAVYPGGSPFGQQPSNDDSMAFSDQAESDPPTGPERCIDLAFVHGGPSLDPVHQLPESKLIAPVTMDGRLTVDTATGATTGARLGSSRVPGPGFSIDGRMFVLAPTSTDSSVGVSCDASKPCPNGDQCGAKGVCLYGDCSAADGSTPCFKRSAPATLALSSPDVSLRSLLPSELETSGALDVYRQGADLVPPIAFHVPDATQVYAWGRSGIVGHPSDLGTPHGRVELFFWKHAFEGAPGAKKLSAPRFFSGCDDEPSVCDVPRFSSLESEAVPVYPEDRLTVNQTSVIWLPSFGRFIMIYGGRLPVWTRDFHPTVTEERALDPYAGVYLRSARHPWGPWSNAVTLYNPYWSNVAGYCELMFLTAKQAELLSERIEPSFPGASCDPSALVQQDLSRPDDFGAEYGSAIVPRFIQDGSDEVTFYWLMSTWNPYRVVVMRSVLSKSAVAVE
ncbi:MAG: DUF4185 domain-containing protein [Myxococcales bacterium]|nr:DUF4185 domain-containing protein [Myxococcales bacterium]